VYRFQLEDCKATKLLEKQIADGGWRLSSQLFGGSAFPLGSGGLEAGPCGPTKLGVEVFTPTVGLLAFGLDELSFFEVRTCMFQRGTRKSSVYLLRLCDSSQVTLMAPDECKVGWKLKKEKQSLFLSDDVSVAAPCRSCAVKLLN
jgi:hypothetical protein